MWQRKCGRKQESSYKFIASPSLCHKNQSKSPKFQMVPPDYLLPHVPMALQDCVGWQQEGAGIQGQWEEGIEQGAGYSL